MKKYIMIALYIATSLNCMETVHDTTAVYTCIWDNDTYKNYSPILTIHHHIVHNHSFKDLTVFNINADEGLAASIAQTAQLVHSVNEINNNTLLEQQKYSYLPNLIFTNPEHNKYDLITAFSLPMKPKKLQKYLSQFRDYLKPSGEIIGTILTQTNDPLIEESIFTQDLCPHIYTKMSPEIQKSGKFNILSQSTFIADKDLEEIIYSTGYDIISKTNIFFNIVIKDQDKRAFKKMLKRTLILDNTELSPEDNKYFCKQFAHSVMAKLKENDDKDLLYPFNITKIHLRIVHWTYFLIENIKKMKIDNETK